MNKYFYTLIVLICSLKLSYSQSIDNKSSIRTVDSVYSVFKEKPSEYENLASYLRKKGKRDNNHYLIIASYQLQMDAYSRAKQSKKFIDSYYNFNQLEYIDDFPLQKFNSKMGLAQVYVDERYYDQALHTLEDAKNYILNSKDKFRAYSVNFKNDNSDDIYYYAFSRLYFTYSQTYERLHNNPLRRKFIRNSIAAFDKTSENYKKNKSVIINIYFIASRIYAQDNITDSANHFYDKGNQLIKQYNIDINKDVGITLMKEESKINLLINQKKYQEALISTKLLEKEYTKFQLDDASYKLIIYELYKLIYNKLDIKDKESYYSNKYIELEKQLNEKKNPELISNQLINENLKQKDSSTKKIITIIIFISLIILSSVAIYFFFVRKKYKKDKENINSEIQKVKENASKELVDLAYDNNSIAFYNRFKEVYPNLILNIEKQYPQLTEQDKIFCTYLYLGFSTKEIASIENVSIRTVDSRKYRLRKKCLLDSNEDLYEWIKSLI